MFRRSHAIAIAPQLALSPSLKIEMFSPPMPVAESRRRRMLSADSPMIRGLAPASISFSVRSRDFAGRALITASA